MNANTHTKNDLYYADTVQPTAAATNERELTLLALLTADHTHTHTHKH